MVIARFLVEDPGAERASAGAGAKETRVGERRDRSLLLAEEEEGEGEGQKCCESCNEGAGRHACWVGGGDEKGCWPQRCFSLGLGALGILGAQRGARGWDGVETLSCRLSSPSSTPPLTNHVI
jgi:hypothetical protein